MNYIFALVLILSTIKLVAQITPEPVNSDTIVEYEYDTVEVIEEPVVIKKTVFVEKSNASKEGKLFWNVHAGPSISSGNLENHLAFQTPDLVALPGFLVGTGLGKTGKHFLGGINVNLLNSRQRFDFYQTAFVKTSVTDTITHYYVATLTDTVTVYVTEEREEENTFDYVNKTEVYNLFHLQFQPYIGFKISKDRWMYYGVGGIAFQYAITNQIFNSIADLKSPLNLPKSSVNTKLGFGVMYSYTQNSSLTIEAWGAKDIATLFDTDDWKIKRNYGGVALGVNYFF